jgi:hypothetical protein
MAKTVKVDKIQITIGKKTIELSPDELKELRDVLDATFPKETTRWLPSQPITIPYPVYPQTFRYWEPRWTSTGDGGTVTLCSTTAGE